MLALISDGLTGAFLVAAYFFSKPHWRISFDSTLAISALAFAVLGIVLLLIASSLIRQLIRGLTASDKEDSESLLELRSRKYFFYAGLLLNMVGLCLLIEITGGVVHSPLTPVLYAMILGGQQLGRFKTNSAMLVTFGAVVTLALLLSDHLRGASVVRVGDASAALSYSILASSFALTAIFTHSDKASNFRVRRVPDPQQVEIYLDRDHVWRYAFYFERTRIDSRLRSEKGFPQTLDDAKVAATIFAADLMGAGRDTIEVAWDAPRRSDECLGQVVRRATAETQARNPEASSAL